MRMIMGNLAAEVYSDLFRSLFCRLCDPSSGDCTHVLSGHSAGVVCVEWSPSEEFVLASASWDGKIKLWDVRYDAVVFFYCLQKLFLRDLIFHRTNRCRMI